MKRAFLLFVVARFLGTRSVRARIAPRLPGDQGDGARPLRRAMAHAAARRDASASGAEIPGRRAPRHGASAAGVAGLARRTPVDRRWRQRAGRQAHRVRGVAGHHRGRPGTGPDARRDGVDHVGPAVAGLGRRSPASRGLLAVAGAYFKLGIEHILFGVDHLLFILGLLLIVKDRWMLVKTVSSFTVAHSITLAIATLGYARAPEPPLTAAIALSILFLGPEIVRSQRGETSLTIRHPWVVAFAFGLLHGFGFASGLTTMGLPRAEIPLALLLFNLGVEAGQILFVIVVLLLERSFRVLEVRLPRVIEALPAYAVGSLGAYWTIQRVVIMLGGAR